jgi:CHAD domain-containing protein
MAFRLKRKKSVARDLSRVLTSELRKARDEIAAWSGENSTSAVHGVRKHVKKIRAVLRLVQKDLSDDYRTLDAPLKKIAHALSAMRDLDASIETLGALRGHYPRVVTPAIFRGADRGLKARQRTARVDLNRVPAVMTRELERVKSSIPSQIRRVGKAAAIRSGMSRGYKRARKAFGMVDARPEDALFHAWRRRVKDHWYQLRLLSGLSRGVRGRVRRLKQLERWLGEEHNLVVLHAIIVAAPEHFGDAAATSVALGCIAKHQSMLRKRTVKEGDRLFAKTPSSFRHQIDAWWAE